MAKIATVGCGLIGQGWAAVFAQAGFEVALYDATPGVAERALQSMQARFADLVSYDLVAAEDVPEILRRFRTTTNLEEVLDGAVYVQENGPENLDVKLELTRHIDALAAKDVPIGSSTSGISASRYCEDIPGRGRCLVVHPINPPHLIPAVEIVPSPWTAPDVVDRVTDLMRHCHRETIVLSEEVDGFVVNRLQGALLEEAFRLVGRGIVSAADLDKAISHGLGLRWSFMGPMQTIHLNAPGGVADYVARYGPMYRGFGIGSDGDADWAAIAAQKLTAELEAQTPPDKITQAQLERDKQLMALMRHKSRHQSDPQN